MPPPPPPSLLTLIAKGDLLLESTPTQKAEIICSSMHSDEIRSVHVGLAAEADAIEVQFGLTTRD